MPGKLTEEESRRVELRLDTHSKLRKDWCLDVLGYLGSFHWAAQQGRWEDDNTDMKMNCWGAPIYIARRTGRLSKKSVADFDLLPFQYPLLGPLHQSQRAAYEYLRGSLGQIGSEGNPGDILLFFIENMSGLTGAKESKENQTQLDYLKTVPFDQCPVHCAVSMGQGECVSLWSTPNDYDSLQLCKIVELTAAIQRDRKTACTYSSIIPFWLAAAQNKSRCYITTAACQSKGLSDDCRELMTLRWFRDTIVAETATGRDHIAKYNATAPEIVSEINRSHDSAQIYDQLFQEYIKPAVAAVELGEHGVAYNLFEVMVDELQRRYGNVAKSKKVSGPVY